MACIKFMDKRKTMGKTCSSLYIYIKTTYYVDFKGKTVTKEILGTEL